MLRGGRQSDWMSLPFPTSTPHPPTPHPPPSRKHQARILSSGLDGQVCSLRGYAVDGHAAGRGSARPSRSAAGRGLAAAEEGGGRLVAVLMRDGPFCARAPRACGVCGRARTRRGAGRCAPSSGGGRSSRGPGGGFWADRSESRTAAPQPRGPRQSADGLPTVGRRASGLRLPWRGVGWRRKSRAA